MLGEIRLALGQRVASEAGNTLLATEARGIFQFGKTGTRICGINCRGGRIGGELAFFRKDAAGPGNPQQDFH